MRNLFEWEFSETGSEVKVTRAGQDGGVGANKGILVTTSSFGPDAYIFAKDKPLVLLNGGNLLHLLEKHGRKARIDLAEAKALAAESAQPS